jgi:hypothetical protein
MANSQDIVTVAAWLMAGGGILTVFGLAAWALARYADDRGGLSKPVAMVGVAIFVIGYVLEQRWGSYW